MLVIRLRRGGVKNKPFYSIVVAEQKFPRDGRYIERVGYYNPFTKDDQERTFLNLSRIDYWIRLGAKLTERTKNLLVVCKRKVK